MTLKELRERLEELSPELDECDICYDVSYEFRKGDIQIEKEDGLDL